MQSSNSMRNVAKVSPSVSKSTSKTSQAENDPGARREHSHFSTFDELYVPWENSVVSPTENVRLCNSGAFSLTSHHLLAHSHQGAVSPLSRDLPPSPMGAVAAIDDMAMVLQDTARAGLTKLMQERQKQSLVSGNCRNLPDPHLPHRLQFILLPHLPTRPHLRARLHPSLHI